MNILIKNNTDQNILLKELGLTILADATRDLTSHGTHKLRTCNSLLNYLGSGDLKLVKDNNFPVTYYEGGEAIQVVSGILNSVEINTALKENENKLYVQATYRPVIAGKNFLTTWMGRSDSIEGIGQGAPFALGVPADSSPGTIVSEDVFINHNLGDVYIHHAYFGYHNAGLGDCIRSTIIAKPTVVIANPTGDMNLDGDRVIYAGPGNGTHSLGSVPALVPAFKQGAWDYAGGNLTPNFFNTGSYDIYTIEQEVYRIVNDFQICGDAASPVTLNSYDTKQILPGYNIRVSLISNSGNATKMWFNIACFRERTI